MVSLSPGVLTAALFVCAVTAVAAEIRVVIKTDDHPTETSWSLIDACPGGSSVITGGGYTSNGVVETITYRARASRYLFVIVDSGGDGLCCDHGADGYYEVLEDGVVQVFGGEFEITEAKFFGKCTMPTTYKPTNQVTSQPTRGSRQRAKCLKCKDSMSKCSDSDISPCCSGLECTGNVCMECKVSMSTCSVGDSSPCCSGLKCTGNVCVEPTLCAPSVSSPPHLRQN